MSSISQKGYEPFTDVNGNPDALGVVFFLQDNGGRARSGKGYLLEASPASQFMPFNWVMMGGDYVF